MDNLKVLLKRVDFLSWVGGECQISKLSPRTAAYYALGKMLRTFHALSHLIRDNNPLLRVLLFYQRGTEAYIRLFAQSYTVSKWQMLLRTSFQM